MDDFTLMMAKMHGDDLRREAEQCRLAAAARSAVRTRRSARGQAGQAGQAGLVARSAHWLASVAGRTRLTAAGR